MSDMGIRVRPMESRDSEIVARLLTQLGYPVTGTEISEWLHSLGGAEDNGFFVAESTDAGVLGAIQVLGYFLLISGCCAEIAALVVDQRARRQGVGRMLVSVAETWAKERGYTTIRVRSGISREEAHAFYRGLGYEHVSTQHRYHKRLEPKDA
jgi:GNAT superfamily N-acetyltransferase